MLNLSLRSSQISEMCSFSATVKVKVLSESCLLLQQSALRTKNEEEEQEEGWDANRKLFDIDVDHRSSIPIHGK